MKIKHAVTEKEKNELDQLLWDVLWKPLDFSRNIRKSFELNNPQIDLIVINNNVLVGALVANWIYEKEIEIRHIAVKSDFQKCSIGRLLIEELIRLVKEEAPLQIQTHARNTSVGFFTRLGFQPRGNRLEHPDFVKYGIWIQQMYIEILQDKSQ